MDLLLHFDYWLFHNINFVWTNSFFDSLLPVLTDLHKNWWFKQVIGPFILFIWGLRERTKAIIVLISAILAFGMSDAFAYRIVKQIVKRDRPQITLEQSVNLKSPPHSGYSFPSNHASNCFAVGTLLSLIYPSLRFVFIFIAALIAYSRVYVGVHFPLDVIGGAILGALWGYISYWFYTKFVAFLRKHFPKLRDLPLPPSYLKKDR